MKKEVVCNHPELRPITWEQKRPETWHGFTCDCGKNWCCPVCGYGQGSYPCDCMKKVFKWKPTIFYIALLSFIILACSAPIQSALQPAQIQGQISTQTPTATTTFSTATPVKLDVSGCWNVRSSPSAADDTNILRTVCDEDVYFLRWAENGFIEIFPLGDGREYICNQATNKLTELECK